MKECRSQTQLWWQKTAQGTSGTRALQVLVLIQTLCVLALAEQTCPNSHFYSPYKIKGEPHQIAGSFSWSKLRAVPLTRLKSDKVGEVQYVMLPQGKELKLITRSLKPLMFEIPDFLSSEECAHIIQLAESKGLRESTTLPDPLEKKDEDRRSTVTDREKQGNCNELMDYDSDRDGSINLLEFSLFFAKQTRTSDHTDELAVAQYILKNQTSKAANLLDKFKELDKDNSGYTTLQECLLADHSSVMEILNDVEENDPRYRSRFSSQTWLDIHGSSDPVLMSLHEREVWVTKLPRTIVERSEFLQVVRYSTYGHYHAHYDTSAPVAGDRMPCCVSTEYRKPGSPISCHLCRYLTILYYLNDVPKGGETAFPVADNVTFNEEVYEDSNLHDLSTHCQQANLYVKPKKGMALLWYNHHLDQATGLLGPVDEYSLHGGCDVIEGIKWIANNWINVPYQAIKQP